QLRLGARRREMEWRLEGGMEAIAARLQRQLVPERRLRHEFVGERNVISGVAVVAEDGAAEPIERRVGGRDEIDRIPRPRFGLATRHPCSPGLSLSGGRRTIEAECKGSMKSVRAGRPKISAKQPLRRRPAPAR